MKRLQLTDREGNSIDFYIDARQVVQVQQAGASQAWHGIRANVKVGDQKWVEVRETPDQIAAQIGAMQ